MTVTSGYVGLRKTQKGARLLTEKIEVESRQQTAFRTIMELEDSCSDNSDFLTLADKMIGKKKKKQSVSLIRNGKLKKKEEFLTNFPLLKVLLIEL